MPISMLTELLTSPFMQRALLAGLCTAVLAPLLGMFLVTRRYAYIADTLAHVSLAGVAVGVLLQTSPIVTALIVTVIAAVCVEELRRRKVLGEAALTLFLSGGLALAAVLLSRAGAQAGSMTSFLFGSIVTVSWNDVAMIALLTLLVVAVTWWCYPVLYAVSLDEELAQTSGLAAYRYNVLVVILTAVVVSVSIRVVGVLLVGALMVIPVLSAQQWGRGFRVTLLLSIGFSVTAVLVGLGLSYVGNTSTGGTIVLTAIALFFFSFARRSA